MSQLDVIGRKLARLNAQKKALEDEISDLKKAVIARMTEEVELEGKSRVYTVPATPKRPEVKVRVSYPDVTPPVDWDALMRDIGPEAFAQACTVNKATLDVGVWNMLVEQETVKDSQLAAHVGEPEPRNPTVVVEEEKKGGRSKAKGPRSTRVRKANGPRDVSR